MHSLQNVIAFFIYFLSVSDMINPAFMKRPEEAALLGAIVIGYGELDISFSHIAGLAINHKFAVLEACQKVRSESARIKIAVALSHEAFASHGLQKQFKHSELCMRWCLKIRNQYAHAQWGDFEKDGLKFTNPENAFQRPLKPTSWNSIDLELLREQEAFFENTRAWLLYLELTLENSTPKNSFPLKQPKNAIQPPLQRK